MGWPHRQVKSRCLLIPLNLLALVGRGLTRKADFLIQRQAVVLILILIIQHIHHIGTTSRIVKALKLGFGQEVIRTAQGILWSRPFGKMGKFCHAVIMFLSSNLGGLYVGTD